MRLIVMLFLGACAPALTAGDTPAGTASESAPAERLFQGVWDYRGLDGDHSLGMLRIEGRRFWADIMHGTYEGSVTIRPDTSPAQIDFNVEDCGCTFDGKAATAIYYEDEDGTIVFASKAPGEPRPTTFAGLDPATHEIVRLHRLDHAPRGDDDAPR